MIEKKEVAEAVRRSNPFSRGMLHDVTEKEVNSPTVLVPTVHISLAGPRTRRSQPGKHGASGVEKPQQTRSEEVAPRRKVGSLDRQLPGGHASKVRCRSRCGASCSILQVARQTQAKAEGPIGAPRPTGSWLSPLVLRSLLRPSRFAHKKLRAQKLAAPKRQARTQGAQFPASCTCRAAMNRQARWPSP